MRQTQSSASLINNRDIGGSRPESPVITSKSIISLGKKKITMPQNIFQGNNQVFRQNYGSVGRNNSASKVGQEFSNQQILIKNLNLKSPITKVSKFHPTLPDASELMQSPSSHQPNLKRPITSFQKYSSLSINRPQTSNMKLQSIGDSDIFSNGGRKISWNQQFNQRQDSEDGFNNLGFPSMQNSLSNANFNSRLQLQSNIQNSIDYLNFQMNELEIDDLIELYSQKCEFLAIDILPELMHTFILSIRQQLKKGTLDVSDNRISQNCGSILAKIIDKCQEHFCRIVLAQNELRNGGFNQILPSIMNHPNLIHLDLSNNSIGSEGICNLFKHFVTNSQTLVSLNISSPNGENRNKIDMKVCKYISQSLQINNILIFLDLGYSQIGPYCLSILAEGILKNPSLEYLNLNFNNLGPQGASPLAQIIAQSNLIEIQAQGNYLGDPVFIQIAEWTNKPLNRPSRLSILNLNNNKLSHTGFAIFMEKTAKISNIEKLYLEKNTLSGAQFMQFSNYMVESYQLTYICLQNCDLTVKQSQYIGEGIKDSQILTTLILSGNYLHDEGAIEIAHGLRYNSSLIKIQMYRCQIQNEGAIALFNSLRIEQIRKQKERELNSVRTSVDNQQYFEQWIGVDSQLQSIDLGFNLISHQAGFHIASCLQTNRNIKYINLEKNMIDHENLEEIEGLLQFNNFTSEQKKRPSLQNLKNSLIVNRVDKKGIEKRKIELDEQFYLVVNEIEQLNQQFELIQNDCHDKYQKLENKYQENQVKINQLAEIQQSQDKDCDMEIAQIEDDIDEQQRKTKELNNYPYLNTQEIQDKRMKHDLFKMDFKQKQSDMKTAVQQAKQIADLAQIQYLKMIEMVDQLQNNRLNSQSDEQTPRNKNKLKTLQFKGVQKGDGNDENFSSQVSKRKSIAPSKAIISTNPKAQGDNTPKSDARQQSTLQTSK